MEMVRLTKSGGLRGREDCLVSDVLAALPCALTLEEGCTLRSFFSLFAGRPVLQKLSRFLPAAVAEMEKCPESGCVNDGIAALVMGKTMELIGFPGKPRTEAYLWLRGLAPERMRAIDADPSPLSDSAQPAAGTLQHFPPLAALMKADKEIRFIPLQILLDTPVFLSGLKHVVLGDVDRHLFCESRFTLFEVVDGLAWELGFQGGAQQCSIGR